MENVQDLFDCFEDSAEDETNEDELPKGVLLVAL